MDYQFIIKPSEGLFGDYWRLGVLMKPVTFTANTGTPLHLVWYPSVYVREPDCPTKSWSDFGREFRELVCSDWNKELKESAQCCS